MSPTVFAAYLGTPREIIYASVCSLHELDRIGDEKRIGDPICPVRLRFTSIMTRQRRRVETYTCTASVIYLQNYLPLQMRLQSQSRNYCTTGVTSKAWSWSRNILHLKMFLSKLVVMVIVVVLALWVPRYSLILVENRDFSYPLHSTPPLGGLRRNISIPFGVEKLEWWGYPIVKKFQDTCNRLDTIPACDRQTDGQTDGHLVTA